RDDDAIGQVEITQPEWSEHRWRRTTVFVEPAIDSGYKLGIANLEIPVSYPPAPGKQIECELERLLARVLRYVFEPLEACLRSSLHTLDHRPALSFVCDQRLIHV